MAESVSVEEAYVIIKEKRGFVSCGGYVLYNGGYFAFGTFPGCMRGGKNSESLEEFKAFCEQTRSLHWTWLKFPDIVRKFGFYPTSIGVWAHYQNWEIPTEETQAIFGLELDMIKYMIDSEYKVADFKCPYKSVEIWNSFLDSYNGK